MKKPAVLVSGSIAYDLCFEYEGMIREHLLKETGPLYINIRAAGPEKRFGGCAGNIAYTLRLLHTGTAVTSWIGADGGPYLEHLERCGVDTSMIHRPGTESGKEIFTPTAVLLSDRGEEQIIVFGEPQHPVVWDLPAGAGDFDLGVIASGMPERTIRLIALLHRRGVPVLIDPGKMIMDADPEALMDSFAPGDILVMNEYETDLFCGTAGVTVKHLLRKIQAVVVTRGKDGCTVYMENTVRIPAVPASREVDAYGAGDAFLAGFAAGRVRGADIIESVKTGAAAAAFAVENSGSQRHDFSPRQFLDRYADTYGPMKTALFTEEI